MNQNKHYFFCGIGGSGMLPLAMIARAKGHVVEGSDRSLDQGRTPQKFDFLRNQGIRLYPQDGTGLTRTNQILVTSAAVEEDVPDVKAARNVGAPRTTRAELLAELFNAAGQSIAVGGTSGKSTTTGMIGWILHRVGRTPTIMNGAVMKNFVTPEMPFASAVAGNSDLFVSEVDESDGSIARYRPRVAVLNNIAFDHKPLDELRNLFGDFVGRAEIAVINLDNAEAATLAATRSPDKIVTYSLAKTSADLFADRIDPAREGVLFEVTERQTRKTVRINLSMPGRHNVANALAALATARACGVTLESAAEALNHFQGIGRRLETVGAANGVTVIDDFAHNPDKIAATLATLHEFSGRLIVLFQPHGFGPLRLMKDAFVACFVHGLAESDILIMPEPVYFGGTVNRSVSSQDIVQEICRAGREAHALADREACGNKILALVQSGDRIVIMGARDDTLSQFAAELLDRLAG